MIIAQGFCHQIRIKLSKTNGHNVVLWQCLNMLRCCRRCSEANQSIKCVSGNQQYMGSCAGHNQLSSRKQIKNTTPATTLQSPSETKEPVEIYNAESFIIPEEQSLTSIMAENSCQYSSQSYLRLMATKFNYNLAEFQNKSQVNRTMSLKNIPSQQYIISIYKTCMEFYSEHNIDDSYKYCLKVQALLKINDNKNLLLQHDKHHDARLKTIANQYQDLIKFQKEIDSGGWEKQYDQNGLIINTRLDNDGTVGCQILSQINVPFEVLIAVLIQMDLYKNFMMYMEHSSQEKVVARNCRIGHSILNFPFIAKRQAYFQGIGYNRLNQPQKEIFMYTRSIHDRPDLQEALGYKTKPFQDNVPLSYKYYVVRYRPLKNGRGLMEMAMNIDINFKMPLPQIIMQKISTNYSIKFFQNLIKLSRNFKGSQWQINVNKSPELFNFFKEILETYHKNSNNGHSGQ